MLPALANHLWQSTLFAAAAFLLALALRRNHARVRHAIWLAASVKFLVPFSILTSLGGRLDWHTVAAIAPPALPMEVEQLSRTFTFSAATVSAPTPAWSGALAVLWIAGCTAILMRWAIRWWRMHSVLRDAVLLGREQGTCIVSSNSTLEPGIFGILRPRLVLPEGITARLSAEQLRAVVAHELCHVRRRDNLAGAIHMVVEAIFWFHPLVWWIGARLVNERERACDEEVLRSGSAPEDYAEGILNVCKLYLQSPLACAAGVSGSELKSRIEAIMTYRISPDLTVGRKLALLASAAAAIGAPVWMGAAKVPRVLAQSLEHKLAFEVASIKPADPDTRGMGFQRTPGGGIRGTGVTLRYLVEWAYDVQNFQVSGGPGWLQSDRYDVVAKPETAEGPVDMRDVSAAEQKRLWDRLRERVRSLLADRFQLVVHKEAKEQSVYLLVVAKNGHKLEENSEDGGLHRNFGVLSGKGVTAALLATFLSNIVGRPVLDRTGLTAKYAFKMEWDEAPTQAASLKAGLPVPPPDTAHDPTGPSLFNAIQEQLGLKLEAEKAPVNHIVIDRAEKPTAN